MVHSKNREHLPVMMNEVLRALEPKTGEVFVDGTFGGGGYSTALLDSADCKVYGIDRDPDAITRGQQIAARYKGRLILIKGCFSEMATLVPQAAEKKVDGVAMDLGISSFQITDASRGFSFLKDGPLDMRMSGVGLTAAEVVNSYCEKELADIFFLYGEEKKSRHIARAIVSARKSKPIITTAQLASLIVSVTKIKNSRKTGLIHPATRIFQALRIFVNKELEELEAGLRAAEFILREGGRLVIVSFHSLEDRIVKKFLKQRSGKIPQGSRHSPPEATPGTWREPTFLLPRGKAERPSLVEITRNPRARSARLRFAYRTSATGLGV